MIRPRTSARRLCLHSTTRSRPQRQQLRVPAQRASVVAARGKRARRSRARAAGGRGPYAVPISRLSTRTETHSGPDRTGTGTTYQSCSPAETRTGSPPRTRRQPALQRDPCAWRHPLGLNTARTYRARAEQCLTSLRKTTVRLQTRCGRRRPGTPIPPGTARGCCPPRRRARTSPAPPPTAEPSRNLDAASRATNRIRRRRKTAGRWGRR